ncbi:MAG: hypothetical protein ACYTFY_22395 [Planctomycetota bacterium]|jgi:hypothetical protein
MSKFSNIKDYVGALVFAVLLFSGCSGTGGGAKINVDPENCVIAVSQEKILTKRQSSLLDKAVKELEKHLELITGKDIPVIKGKKPSAGKYPFYVGIPGPGNNKELASQESRWQITPEGAYFTGDLTGYGTGVQSAVYSFLEDQLGVNWIEPGDEGIVYKKMSTLALRGGEFNWIPKLMFRKIRSGGARVAKKMDGVRKDYKEFAEFQPCK